MSRTNEYTYMNIAIKYVIILSEEKKENKRE